MGRENFLGLMFGMQNNVIYAVGLFQSSDRMRLSWLSLMAAGVPVLMMLVVVSLFIRKRLTMRVGFFRMLAQRRARSFPGK
jgi:hypothetical protein